MKVVHQSASLSNSKKRRDFREAKNSKLLHKTGSNEDVKRDKSPAAGYKPKVVQGVKTNVVLVEGIKCRSQLKCKAMPEGCASPGCSVALGERKRRKYTDSSHVVIFRSSVGL